MMKLNTKSLTVIYLIKESLLGCRLDVIEVIVVKSFSFCHVKGVADHDGRFDITGAVIGKHCVAQKFLCSVIVFSNFAPLSADFPGPGSSTAKISSNSKPRSRSSET